MPLQNFQYDTIMREYSRRQAQNHRILEEHTAEAYGKIPRLKEIDDEVATLSADKVRRLLNGEEKGTSDLKAAIQELSDERITLLVANGFPGDYLEMPYPCPDCQDTGYIGSRKCTCFKKAEIELLYAQSNLNEILEKENFEVEIVSDGSEAWKAYKERKPDILLLDLDMPGKDGLEITRLVREHDQQTPILVYTTHGEPAKEPTNLSIKKGLPKF